MQFIKNKIFFFGIILLSIFILTNNIKANNQTALPPKKLVWPFDGFLGNFDRKAAQRGAQVYFEVCATCHGMDHLYYRNLSDIGFSEEEIKAIAANYEVTDGPNHEGEIYQRSAKPGDLFVNPYPNEESARAAQNGAHPPDLSLIIKARHDGANYVYSLLTGYDYTPPENLHLSETMHYNPYFEGGKIAMPAPLSDDLVEYQDGTNATVSQMASDVVVFLQWAAEPEMEHRKLMGLKVMIFLSIFTLIFFLYKRKIWKKIK